MSGKQPPVRQDAGATGSDERILSRVRTRVLGSIANESTARHLTVRHDDSGWQPFLDGVQCKVLRADDTSMSYLLRLAPGATLPAHRHPHDEECMVLEGELRIGSQLVVSAGDYHLAKAGVPHADITTERGALIFLRGLPPEPAHLL